MQQQVEPKVKLSSCNSEGPEVNTNRNNKFQKANWTHQNLYYTMLAETIILFHFKWHYCVALYIFTYQKIEYKAPF